MAETPGGVTLIVFARRPRAGTVKRRLARVLGGRRAADLYAGLLEHTLRAAELSGIRRRLLLCAAAADVRWFRHKLKHRGWRVGTQCPGDLGRRMERALAGVLGDGPALLIGSDIVDLRASDLAAGAVLLKSGQDAVIGPARDGGYWLIGLSRDVPPGLMEMPWSSALVACRTERLLTAQGLSCARLPRRSDLDHARDLLSRDRGGLQRRRTSSRSSRAT